MAVKWSLESVYPVLWLLFHSVRRSQSHPQCLDASPPGPSSSPLTMCTQYSDLGCCSPQQENYLVDSYQLVRHRMSEADWKKCHGYVKELLCQRCSPWTAHLYDGDSERALPGMCGAYCRRLYKECRDIIWFLDPHLASTIHFQTESEFCTKTEISDMTYCYPDVLEASTSNTLGPLIEDSSHQPSQKGCLCLDPVLRGFANPIFARNSGDGTGRLFVGEQRGVVYVTYPARRTRLDTPFLDLSNRVILTSSFGDERGMGGLAFHPKFSHNGRLFVYYNAPITRAESESGRKITGRRWIHKSVLSEMRVLPDHPDQVDTTFEKVLLEVGQPYSNHNGGEMFFLDDGYLYLFLGDGGYAGDPHNMAQNRSVLLGKVLRLDIDTPSSVKGRPYSIPDDNPFLDELGSGVRPEIFAYGVRNIWRCGIDLGDPITGWGKGRVLCGDVGQSLYEEIDVLKKGANYGWRAREGMQCYDNNMCSHIGEEELPVFVYDHAVGQSVTGGNFYRGCRSPSLNGKYLYGDYQNGQLFSLEESHGGKWHNSDVILCGDDMCNGGLTNMLHGYILSFGQDQQGEVYVLASKTSLSNTTDGTLFMMVDPFSEKTAEECNDGHK